jgi:hypothetical protein
MLKLDLLKLETPERFEQFCARLARREYPDSLCVAGSWDGGRDILRLVPHAGTETLDHEVIWQVKFIRRLDATTKRSIEESLRSALDLPNSKIGKWILCIPVKPSGTFHDWLARKMSAAGITNWEIWGADTLLEKLEANRDLLETFFYPVYAELQRYFAVEKLELHSLRLDDDCQWKQPDPKVLVFTTGANVDSPPLVLDVIVRNTGQVAAVLLELEVEIGDWEWKPHGVPGTGLLYSQFTYAVSVAGGQPGVYRTKCEPPLKIDGEDVERFKISLVDTGYAWRGNIVVSLDYGPNRVLRLPAMRLYT